MNEKQDTTPYVLAGAGYEHVRNADKGRLDSHAFVQAGVGLRHRTPKRVQAKCRG